MTNDNNGVMYPIFTLDNGKALRFSTENTLENDPCYTAETGLDTVDVIEAFTFDLTGIEAFCIGNALKLLCRWKNKNGVKDLESALWYIKRAIKHVNNLEQENNQ